MLNLNCQYFGYVMQRTDSLEKTLMLGKIESKRRRGATEDEMVGWYYQLNRDEFEQTLGDEGQGSLACSVHVVTKSWTQLSNRTTIYLSIYICTCI